jgi:hypothetical protein
MKLEEIKGVLTDTLPLRSPTFLPVDSARIKVAALEDFMLAGAHAHGELEEALHWLDAVIAHLKDKITRITGYEVALPRKPKDRLTQADITAAKRTLDPATFEAGAEAQRLRASILRQIARLEHEHSVVSRAYSLISGG